MRLRVVSTWFMRRSQSCNGKLLLVVASMLMKCALNVWIARSVAFTLWLWGSMSMMLQSFLVRNFLTTWLACVIVCSWASPSLLWPICRWLLVNFHSTLKMEPDNVAEKVRLNRICSMPKFWAQNSGCIDSGPMTGWCTKHLCHNWLTIPLFEGVSISMPCTPEGQEGNSSSHMGHK